MSLPETPEDSARSLQEGGPSPRAELLLGLGVGLAVSAAFAAASLLVAVVLSIFGVLQLAWMWPLAAYFKGKGRSHAAQGVWLAAALVFLLSGACWGFVMFSLSKGNPH